MYAAANNTGKTIKNNNVQKIALGLKVNLK